MENLKIYVDRLKDGNTEKLKEELDPAFLEIAEEELSFNDPVHLKGDVSIVSDHLVIHLNVQTFATLPCSICNAPIRAPIVLKNICLTHPLTEIHGGIFDLAEEIRESILLQTPLFTECNEGHCPERENVKKFLKTEEEAAQGDIHFPFSDLK